MQELLFLAHRIPYPPNKGDKIRSYYVLRHLAQRYRVHVGAFIDDASDAQYLPQLRALCGECCVVPLRPPLAKLRSLSALLSGEPLTLAYYRSRRLTRWVRALLRARPIERVLAFSSPMAQYVEHAARPRLRRVMDFVDVDSEKWRQYSAEHRFPMSWLYAREAQQLLRYEQQVAIRFDASVFVSQAEADLFCRLAPQAASRVSSVENGVDADYFAPTRTYPDPYAPGEEALVFTGAMDYWANAQAVTGFAREVFAVVHARNPRARFYIVGARPGEPVRRLGDLPGVRVTGAVPDVRPYLAHARAAVAPLRVARGVQNKVLEALAMGRPVLASREAVDGLRPTGLPVIVAGGAGMAEEVLRLLAEAAPREAQSAARAYVLKYYDWSQNLARLGDIIEGRGTPQLSVARVGGART